MKFNSPSDMFAAVQFFSITCLEWVIKIKEQVQTYQNEPTTALLNFDLFLPDNTITTSTDAVLLNKKTPPEATVPNFKYFDIFKNNPMYISGDINIFAFYHRNINVTYLQTIETILNKYNDKRTIIKLLETNLPLAETNAKILNFIAASNLLQYAIGKGYVATKFTKNDNVFKYVYPEEIVNYMTNLIQQIAIINNRINANMPIISDYDPTIPTTPLTPEDITMGNSSNETKIMQTETMSKQVVTLTERFLTELLFQNYGDAVNKEILSALYSGDVALQKASQTLVSEWRIFYINSLKRRTYLSSFVHELILDDSANKLTSIQKKLRGKMVLVVPKMLTSNYLYKTLSSGPSLENVANANTANGSSSFQVLANQATKDHIETAPIDDSSIKNNANLLRFCYMLFLLFLILQNFQVGQYFLYYAFFQLRSISTDLAATLESVITTCVKIKYDGDEEQYKTACIAAIKDNIQLPAADKGYSINYKVFPPRKYFIELFGHSNTDDYDMNTDTINTTEIKTQQSTIFNNIVTKFKDAIAVPTTTVTGGGKEKKKRKKFVYTTLHVVPNRQSHQSLKKTLPHLKKKNRSVKKFLAITILK